MTVHSIDIALLFAVGGLVAFIVAWYLIGIGVAIAQRGFARFAPYKVKVGKLPPPPEPSNIIRPTYSWKDTRV